jgi:hypothetical protein
MTETWQIALFGSVCALVGGILGGLLSGAYQHWRDWLSRPRIRIDYDPVAEANNVVIKRQTDNGEINEVYIRARVSNTGGRPAKGAQVFLTSLRKKYTSGGDLPNSIHDSAIVSWAGHKLDPRDIPRDENIHFYVDLVRFSDRDALWDFRVDKLFKGQQVLNDHRGTYLFRLIATAENAGSASCEVEVFYDGKLNTRSAKQVSSSPSP